MKIVFFSQYGPTLDIKDLFQVEGLGTHVGSDEQTSLVLSAMAGISRAAAKNAHFVKWVNLMVPDSTPESVARGIYTLLKNRFKFVPDPVGEELLRHPFNELSRMLNDGEGVGDCDDRAMMGAAMLLAKKMPAAFIVIQRKPNRPFEHVLVGTRVRPDAWYPLDPQVGTPPGTVTPASRMEVFPI